MTTIATDSSGETATVPVSNMNDTPIADYDDYISGGDGNDQIHGGYGYVKEYDVERFFRDAKVLEIGEGTSEIQRLIISKEIVNSVKKI